MQYTARYESPLGVLLLASNGAALTGLWFEGQKHSGAATASPEQAVGALPVFAAARRWLDIYFGGTAPDFMPPLAPEGTAFRRTVWQALAAIPYGKTMTYGAVAAVVAKEMGRDAMSARAVGGAVGHNPISIIVPCHRVVGAGGNLTGYAAGIEKKAGLLRLEGAHMTGMFVPKKDSVL